MSSLEDTTSENCPLLGHSQASDHAATTKRFGVSPETLIIPVAFATRLAVQIPITTIIELLRTAVCKLWNVSHSDPSPLPAGGLAEFCDAPEIAKYFATAVAVLCVIEGVIGVAWCGVINRIASHYGRKPALLFVLATGIMGSCMKAGSQTFPDWLSHWVFIVGLLVEFFSRPTLYDFLVNTYIVDLCAPKDRIATLSRTAGWAVLGNFISFALGGSVTTVTGNPAVVLYMAAAIYVTTFTYVIIFLPESFPEEKRRALSYMPLKSRPRSGVLLIAGLSLLRTFGPLKALVPSLRSDGTRNWRLAWCATHTLLFMAANSYVTTAWLIFVTSKYHLSPADTGMFLTVSAASGMAFLALIVPRLIHYLRPYYRRKPVLVTEEDRIEGGEQAETSDRLDVHLAFSTCVIAGVAFLGAVASTTKVLMIISAIFIGISYEHTPATRSLVAGSVDPLKQGEALAAIEIISNIGNLLSPIAMGGILSATIESMPLLAFHVHLVVVLISGVLLFLVRDTDGYAMT